jgi:hypothetical protein
VGIPGCYAASLQTFCDYYNGHNEQIVNRARPELVADGSNETSQVCVSGSPLCAAVVASPATVAVGNGRELTVATAKRCHFFDVASEGLRERSGGKEGRGER